MPTVMSPLVSGESGCPCEDAEVCPKCGDFVGSETYGTVGDGFDGLCPSCADKAEADNEDEDEDEE